MAAYDWKLESCYESVDINNSEGNSMSPCNVAVFTKKAPKTLSKSLPDSSPKIQSPQSRYTMVTKKQKQKQKQKQINKT